MITAEEYSYAKWLARTGMSWHQYKQVRAKVWAEQGFKCGKCKGEIGIDGKKGEIELHHKDGNPRNNKRYNLVVLCPVCHKQAHRGKSWRQREVKQVKNPIASFLERRGHSSPEKGAENVQLGSIDIKPLIKESAIWIRRIAEAIEKEVKIGGESFEDYTPQELKEVANVIQLMKRAAQTAKGGRDPSSIMKQVHKKGNKLPGYEHEGFLVLDNFADLYDWARGHGYSQGELLKILGY
jgi:hypothetical protein